jgi:succinate-semialdehyde dehydrogenase / glutarate-semialdehyde dehydrogenase
MFLVQLSTRIEKLFNNFLNMTKIQSINPFTEEINWEFELLDENQMNAKIDLAHQSYLQWKIVPKSEKKKLFLNLAQIIEDDINVLAKLQTIEMGMLYTASMNGLLWTAKLIRWFANNFEQILAPTEFDSEWFQWQIMYDPLGVIFWIGPWNFPFNQILRAAIPNILAWNTTVYKHASNVPLCAMKIEELFLKAWFMEGVYINLPIPSSLSEKVLSNPKIAWVNLTGWEWAGRAIWALSWYNLKPSVLELGWNDAFVVCDTDNLNSIIDSAVAGRIKNGGQACNSSKRFIVTEQYYDVFCEKVAKKMSHLILWDPLDEKTQLQPLSSEKLLLEVDAQVQKSIQDGAKLLTWGKRIERKWFFYAPTVLKDVIPWVASYDEEIFWPVMSVIKSKDLSDSIRIANDSSFWLCACVYWDNHLQVREVASKIEAGIVFINSPASSKASLPFGGVKKSWYGKENWPDWLLAFTNKKVILY